MDQRRLSRWVSALVLAGFMALSGQALAQSSPGGPANPQDILISQASNSNVSNADASFLVSISSQAADDFVVPSTLFWHITTVTARGTDRGTTGSGLITLNVQFYGDSGTSLPGTLLYSKAYPSNSSTHLSDGSLVVPLNPIFIVGPGHYWFSVQPVVSSCTDQNCRRWQWNESSVQQYHESAWQGNWWLNSCKVWQPRVSVCGRPVPSYNKDLAFELDGTTSPVVGRVLLPLIRR